MAALGLGRGSASAGHLPTSPLGAGLLRLLVLVDEFSPGPLPIVTTIVSSAGDWWFSATPDC